MSNYQNFFSLQRPLFESADERGFVYESDQLKNAAESFQSAFAKPGPLLCVGGQLGCGKSSTVNFALDQLGEKTRRISVGRIRLSEDEVIDLLLEKLNVDDTSGGTIKKLGRFAKRVEELRDSGERVVVIVEDAGRTGAHILSELEVLCGGDGGPDVALIVCGDEDLRALLKRPELAHISQRMSDFVRLAPFAVDELEDYLRHAVSEAGGDYGSIFGKDYAGLTHILSCGVPRIANKLTEASLAAAAKSGVQKVSCALLADVAKSRFDIETELPVHRAAPEAPKPAAGKTPTPATIEPAAAETPKPAVAEKPKPELAERAPAKPPAPTPSTQAAPTPAVAKSPTPEARQPEAPKPPRPEKSKPATAAQPASEPRPQDAAPPTAADATSRQIPDVEALTGGRDEKIASAPKDFDIPHLIQDTQPELKALSEKDSDSRSSKDTDSSGAFVSLPNLEDLTAEFAAVSQMIESLPTSRYDEDENNSEIEDAFSDFGALDKALEPSAPEKTEPSVDSAPSSDATSTVLPKLKIPNDPTRNEDSTPSIDEPETAKPKAAEEAATSATTEPVPELKQDAPEKPPASTVKTPASEVPTLRAESPEPEHTAVAEKPTDKPAVNASVPPPVNKPQKPESGGQHEILAETDAVKIEAPAAEQKDWDKDPTLAELKPDFDALELAMGEDIELASEPPPAPVEEKKPDPVKAPEVMPEITLDNSIQEKVEAASSESEEKADEGAEKGSDGPTDTEVHRMMEDLSKSSSLEDMDDKLAETLFGDEINLVASQVLKAARESMDKKSDDSRALSKPDASMELSLEQTSENPIPTQPPAGAEKSAQQAKPAAKEFADDEGEVIDLKSMQPNSGLDMSASQRLRTVRALNAGMGKAPPPQPQKPKAAAPPKEKPVPIEDQIDLSMTATFKALKIDPNALQQQEEEETEKKGFFSRFRKKG